MKIASVPVDLLNPGQVFACLGLMELAEVLLGPVTAGFDWSDPASARFLLHSEGEEDPVAAGLRFLSEAEVVALAPHGAEFDTTAWKLSIRTLEPGDSFPIFPPSAPATLPAVLRAGSCSAAVSSWGEGRVPGTLGSGRDNVKVWAGSGGIPGAALIQRALDAARPGLSGPMANPFELSCPQSSSLRFDWRGDYVPIDIGFSLNEHKKKLYSSGHPVVEVLAVIGLTHARPSRRHKLEYRYSVAGRSDRHEPIEEGLLPPPFLRAALGDAPLPFNKRTFTMKLDWPGKVNQARCITSVLEETFR